MCPTFSFTKTHAVSVKWHKSSESGCKVHDNEEQNSRVMVRQVRFEPKKAQEKQKKSHIIVKKNKCKKKEKEEKEEENQAKRMKSAKEGKKVYSET